MIIETKAYGQMDINERQILDFPQGLLGFESQKQWALLDSKQAPFYWLQSLIDSNLAFVLIAPSVFRRDWILELSESDRESLGFPFEEDLISFAIVTIPTDQNRMTANLQGPIVINRPRRIGRQTIQTGGQWKVRHFIMEELAASGAL